MDRACGSVEVVDHVTVHEKLVLVTDGDWFGGQDAVGMAQRLNSATDPALINGVPIAVESRHALVTFWRH